MQNTNGGRAYKSVEWYIALLLLGAAITGFSAYKLLNKDKPTQRDLIEACHQRGIEYFKGSPSYPVMQSEPNKGRLTADVVWERCKRTTTAF